MGTSRAAGADNTARAQRALDELRRKNAEKRAELASKRSATLAALELSKRAAAEAQALAAEAAEQGQKTRSEEAADRRVAEERRKQEARDAALEESAKRVADLPGGRGGMNNVGNSCFVNSVVQALFAVPGFDAVVSCARSIPRDPGADEVARVALVQALLCVREDMRTSVAGCGTVASSKLANAAWAAMKCPRGSQRDACEFFLKLLGSLETSLFVMQRQQVVTCSPIGRAPHTHTQPASESNILLFLPDQGDSDAPDLVLQDLLDARLTHVEDIDYRCHHECAHEASADADRECNLANPNRTRAEQTFSLPDAYGGSVVCVCLRRFDSTHIGNRKNMGRVEILEHLRFRQDNEAVPFLTGTLVAVVVHLGTASNRGHFVTFARPRPRTSADGEAPNVDLWLCFNDDQVEERTADFLLSDEAARNAWLLFYHVQCVQSLLSL